MLRSTYSNVKFEVMLNKIYFYQLDNSNIMLIRYSVNKNFWLLIVHWESKV